jgi:uncharacterized membrane protein
MRHRVVSRPWFLPGLALGLALWTAPQAWGLADHYTLTDLGPAGGPPAVAKDDNRVIGEAANPSDERNPTNVQFLPTHLNLDDVLGAASFITATAAGRIVGSVQVQNAYHGLLYDVATGAVQDLSQTLASETLGSDARAVTHDDVGGWAASPDSGLGQPILWIDSTTPVYLDTLGGDRGVVEAINEKGDAVGSSRTAAGDTHCTFWPAAGGIVDCHPPTAGTFSAATDINAQGLFVGEFQPVEGAPEQGRGFLGLPYGTVVLPPLSGDRSAIASGINSLGDIVGTSCGQTNGCHPTAWVNGVPVDLTPRITNASGVAGMHLYGISDDGWIVGVGALDGNRFGELHTVLLTPVDNATVAWYKWRYQISRYYQDRYDRWRKSIAWYYREQARAARR